MRMGWGILALRLRTFDGSRRAKPRQVLRDSSVP